jgi:hypothetical protein
MIFLTIFEANNNQAKIGKAVQVLGLGPPMKGVWEKCGKWWGYKKCYVLDQQYW